MTTMKQKRKESSENYLRKIVLLILILPLIPSLISPRLFAELKKERMYDTLIQVISSKYDIPSDLIHSIIRTESNYDPLAISPKGAMGLMQLMPETAKVYGVNNVFDPAENIEGGVKYLNDLIKLFNRKTHLVLAAYNAGQEAVKKYGGIPPYKETKEYIRQIMSSYNELTIRKKTIIYKFYDKSGRLVLTNTPYLYSFRREEEGN